MSPERILAVNAGSSSLKFALYSGSTGDQPYPVLRGRVAGHRIVAADSRGALLLDRAWTSMPGERHDIIVLLNLIEELAGNTITAAGHRIVHGGSRFRGPALLTREVLEEVETLTPLAPLHQPLALGPMVALMEARPELPQVCCFDTAFHHDLMPPVSRYAIPRALEEQGIRRYGFHGLSYRYVAQRLARDWPELSSARVIAAHLGSGASLCAMRDGRSVDTTMGFSALDGVVMATRPGSIDPGILLHLMRSGGLSLDQLEDLLYHQCGLLGVSGQSGDVRTLLASDHPAAAEAVDLFVFSIAKQIAALAVTLGGLDVLVFTGGIGEHSAAIRMSIVERLGWLRLRLDPEDNKAGISSISASDSRVLVLVIPTDEEQVIAEQTLFLLQGSDG